MRVGVQSYTGLEYFEAIVRGELSPPPSLEFLGFTVVGVQRGEVSFVWDPGAWTLNAVGSVHGGIVCALLDTAASAALLSVLPEGKAAVSMEIKVNYLRPVQPNGGSLSATGRVVKEGRRVGFTEATVMTDSGAVVATASSTLLIAEAVPCGD